MTTIVIMPGGFHPFHAGHYALYQSAQRAFPDADVYVAATDDVTTRPFPFQVKEKLAQLAGVDKGRFMRVKSPFKAEEITAPYNPARDTLIFVRSEKDSTKPPQAGGVKRDGSPAYLQPLLGAKKLEPFAKHAYMAYLPTVEFGPGMTSATEIRTAWPTLNDKRKTALVMSLYPRTQGNAKLAATVVGLLDAAIGTEQSVSESQEFMSDAQFYGGLLSVLATMGAGLAVGAYMKIKDVVKMYNADQIIKALEGYQVTNISAKERQVLTGLIAQFKQAMSARQGAEALAIAKQIKSISTNRSPVAEGVDPATYPARAKEAHEKYLKYENLVDQELRKFGQRLPKSWNAGTLVTKLSSDPKYALALKYYNLSEKFAGLAIWYEDLAKKRQGVAEGSESSIQKKIQAKQDSLSLAREQRRARGQRQQGPREIKLQAEIDKLNTELTQLKRQGVAEGSEQDAKFTPRPEIRSRIETQLDQYLDPEKVAGAYTDVQYYKHDSRVYVEVLFHYTDGQKIGPKQRKRFLVNKDFTLTPIKEQGVAEGAPIVVAQAPIDVRNPKKSPQPYRNQGDIVPDTKPPSTEKRGVKGRPGQRPMPKYDEGMAEAAKKCPPATQDIGINLENRQKAIDEYGYGPLNPDLPNTKFWMLKVDEWNLDSMEEAQQSLCGNCAAFDIRQDTLDCIAQGIDSDSPEDAEGVIDAGELGYCKFLKFKCASRRTCDAWVTGGPLQDKPVDENQGWAATYETSAQNFVGGMKAGYQRRENQPPMENQDYIEEKQSK